MRLARERWIGWFGKLHAGPFNTGCYAEGDWCLDGFISPIKMAFIVTVGVIIGLGILGCGCYWYQKGKTAKQMLIHPTAADSSNTSKNYDADATMTTSTENVPVDA